MKLSKDQFAEVYKEAHDAGVAAMNACRPRPMVVTEYANPLHGILPNQQPGEIKNQWFVADGVCGFAWISIHPGSSSFARWLVKHGRAHKSYGETGVRIWVSEGNQSVKRKEAYAEAFAKVLQSYGITAYAGSRLD